MRKRLYKPIHRDVNYYNKRSAEDIVEKLSAKPYLSEWEFKTLEMEQAKIKHIRRMKK